MDNQKLSYRLDGVESNTMKYFSESKVDGSVKEITKEEAKRLLDGNYRNIDEMLEIEQTIPLLFRYIIVTK